MMGKAPIRYELRARPLERAISPGRGGVVEGGTWRFLGFCTRVAPDEGVTGERAAPGPPGHVKEDDFLAEAPTDMIVSSEKSSRHPRIPSYEV
jgi:hypothetical protein